jgi:hypothetical protein
MECGRFFCRECVIEHEDRLVCASCLSRLSGAASEKRRRLAALSRILQAALGVIILWFFFYGMGQALLSLPSSFHEGTVWKTGLWDQR